MIKEFVEATDFREIILKNIPVIDVRAPVEFALGCIPGSVNLPILNNEERHIIGTTYKEQGQSAAVSLGHELVSGEVKKNRVAGWTDFIKKNPEAVITCFRGGLRSKISQSWAVEADFQRPRIQGGYKAFRQYLLNELDRLSTQPMWVVSGSTGSGKTLLIAEAEKFCSTVNLEFLAKHRGSAFGAYGEMQPSQSDYENNLVAKMIKLESLGRNHPLVVEDESRMIGKIVQPEKFFSKLRESQLVFIQEPLESRVQTIFDEYIFQFQGDALTEAILRYHKAFEIISRKLGHLRFQEVSADLKLAEAETLNSGSLELHKVWIEKLLVWYYDPLYFASLKKRQPRILFTGTRSEARAFLQEQCSKDQNKV